MPVEIFVGNYFCHKNAIIIEKPKNFASLSSLQRGKASSYELGHG